MLKATDQAPDVGAMNQEGERVYLRDFKGQRVVLYFYPKDNTPGCTLESCGFQHALADFQKAGIHVIGVSMDTLRQHKNFATKFDLTFPLLADTEGEICEAFGVLADKSMFGKKYRGIDRTTFLIDEDGIITHVWSKVNVVGHVSEVLKRAVV